MYPSLGVGGRKGSTGRSGCGKGGYSPPGLVKRCMHVPSQAIGLVIGKGGRSIKELQQTEGIHSVGMDKNSGVLTICGTDQAVAVVVSQVEKHINTALGGQLYELVRHIVHFGRSSTGMVALKSVQGLSLPVDLCDSRVGRAYYTLCQSQEITIEERMTLLSLSGGSATVGEPAFAFTIQKESYSKDLEACLERIQEMPHHAKLRVEARCGMTLFAHVPEGMAQGRPLPHEAFARLQPHKDLIPNFFCTLKMDVVERIKLFLMTHGFIAVPAEELKVVHMIDMRTLKRVALTIAELEDGGDPRVGAEKEDEIERIKACKTLYDIFGVDKDCSGRDIQKAYYKLSKVVHPDKNSHPDADSVMKVVNDSKERLMDSTKRLQYDRHPTRPQWQEQCNSRASNSNNLKVLKCHADERRHLTLQVIRDTDELGARILTRSYTNHAQDPELLKFLDNAWTNRADDFLSVETGEKFRVDCVRQKTKYRFSDGDLKVIIERVHQKDIGGSPMDRWEVEIRSHDLKTAVRSLCGNAVSSDRLDTVKQLFQSYVSGVNGLLTAFAEVENSVRTIADRGHG